MRFWIRLVEQYAAHRHLLGCCEYDIEVFLLKRPKKKVSLVVDLICSLPDKWEDVICEQSAVVYDKLNIRSYPSNQ